MIYKNLWGEKGAFFVIFSCRVGLIKVGLPQFYVSTDGKTVKNNGSFYLLPFFITLNFKEGLKNTVCLLTRIMLIQPHEAKK